MPKVSRKLCCMTAIVLASAAGAFALNHFSYIATGYNMTVSIQTSINPNVDGISLAAGDEIAVFNTTGLCVGARAWNGTSSISISVQGTDPEADSINGMQNREKMAFRIWRSSLNTEVAAQVTYNGNTSLPLYADSLYVQNKYPILRRSPESALQPQQCLPTMPDPRRSRRP